MRTTTIRAFALAMLALAGCGPNGAKQGAGDPPQAEQRPRAPEAEVVLKSVKYDQLVAAVRSHIGKVVVVDVWASWCVPCKKEFPHLVELHNKYPGDVVCISVSVDDPDKEAAALGFLRSQKATFPNYRLDVPDAYPREWQEKWNVTAIPIVFVFDRAGGQAGRFTFDDPDKQFSYDEDVTPLVARLVGKK